METLSGIRRRRSRFIPVAILLLSAGWIAHHVQSEDQQKPTKPAVATAAKSAGARGPEYTEQGELKLPEGFESWVFVGSNLGLEYREDAAKDEAPAKNRDDKLKKASFHNVYINPEAYEHFAKTGKFPDKTMLVLDVYRAEEGEPKSVVSEGLFPGKRKEIALAVKNSARPDGSKTDWAYYDFPPDKKTAKAFPDSACYDCHLQHADVDNVWVQLYPTLRSRK
ncbi:MAG: cytochrome P460 family protein [Planctomycetia bacterium]|nr:cytochrome P460 family protein [Planctomycetia bacterium]